MNKFVTTLAGLTLVSGLAVAAQDQPAQPVDPAQPAAPTHDTMPEQNRDRMMQSGQDQMSNQLSGMTAKELKGKSVTTLTGEEIGEIEDVGRSGMNRDRVATVDVGGFLGIGEKRIAIPLSELMVSGQDKDTVTTSLSKTSIEARAELDEADFTSETETKTHTDANETDY